jgi:2-dehydropantoate 2-reductase
MKILVMGAGGVGSYYGAKLQQSGEDVVLCVRGENLRVMRERGLEVKSYKGDFKIAVKATDRPADFAPYDLVLFAVKSYDTEASAKQLVDCLAPDGIIMTIQNGVENEEILCRYLIAPGVVMHTALGVIEFGELDGSESPRALRLAELFRKAGIFGELTTDLKTLRWYKLMGNNGTNTVCALSLSTLGKAFKDPDGYVLVRTLMTETVAVGRAEGARMEFARIETYLQAVLKNLNVDAIKPSTLQDLEKGKRLEYDAISGAVIRAAQRHGIKVPATETVNTLLKLLDGSRTSAPK